MLSELVKTTMSPGAVVAEVVVLAKGVLAVMLLLNSMMIEFPAHTVVESSRSKLERDISLIAKHL